VVRAGDETWLQGIDLGNAPMVHAPKVECRSLRRVALLDCEARPVRFRPQIAFIQVGETVGTVVGSAHTLDEAAERLHSSSDQIAQQVTASASQATYVAEAAAGASGSINTVTAGATEMSAALRLRAFRDETGVLQDLSFPESFQLIFVQPGHLFALGAGKLNLIWR